LIYALILSILTIDKDVLYHVYILSVLYENNYKIICLTKTIIVLWKTQKMTNNKYNLYQIYEFKIIVYDMTLKWIILFDIMLMIMCVMIKKKIHMINWRDSQVKIKIVF